MFTSAPSLRTRVVSKDRHARREQAAREYRFPHTECGWNQQRDRLADHLLRRITEQPLRARIPARDDAVEVLADDGILGTVDDCCEPLLLLLCLLAFADIDKHVDSAGQLSGRVEQRCRKGNERNTSTVGTFGYSFHATDRLLLLQRHRHRALVVRQRRAIRPVELPGTAELAFAEFRAAAPKCSRSLVVKGDASRRIRHVDRGRKCLDRFPRQTVDITQVTGSCLTVGCGRDLWLCPNPSQCRTPLVCSGQLQAETQQILHLNQ